MSGKLTFEDLEKVYDRVAAAIDEVGPADESLFLCKLCLNLVHHIDDLSLIDEAIDGARADLHA